MMIIMGLIHLSSIEQFKIITLKHKNYTLHFFRLIWQDVLNISQKELGQLSNNLIKLRALVYKGSVVSFGNFDGLHIAHLALLNKLDNLHKQYNLPKIIINFEPLPSEIFRHPKPARITNLREKIECLQSINKTQDAIFILLKFSTQVANLSADDFLQLLLLKCLNCKHLIIGDDLRFGKKQQGDFKFLQDKYADIIQTTQMDSIFKQNSRISSSLIRDALAKHNLILAKELLGRNLKFIGRIKHGEQLGKRLGFPTINLQHKRKLLPLSGVYLAVVTIDNDSYFGVANFGMKPTVNKQTSQNINVVKASIEMFIFEFKKQVYGKLASIVPLEFIRKEKKFHNIEALKQQIYQDVIIAKKLLTKH